MRHAIVLVVLSLRALTAQSVEVSSGPGLEPVATTAVPDLKPQEFRKISYIPQVVEDCGEYEELPLVPEGSVEKLDLPESPIEKLDLPESPIEKLDLPESPIEKLDLPESPIVANESPQSEPGSVEGVRNSVQQLPEKPQDPVERLSDLPTDNGEGSIEYLGPLATPKSPSNQVPSSTGQPIERLDTTLTPVVSTESQFEYLGPLPERSTVAPQSISTDQPIERLDSTPVPTTSTQVQYEYLGPIPEASTAAPQPLVQTTASPTVRPIPVAIVEQSSSSSEAPTTQKYDGFELIGSIDNSESTTSGPTDAPASSSTTGKYDGFEFIGRIREESGEKYAGFEKLGNVEDVPTTPPTPPAAPLSDGLEFVGEEPPSTVLPTVQSTVQVVQTTAPPAPVNLVPIETPATTTTAPVTSKYSGFVYYGQEKIQPPVVVVDPTTTEAPETSPTTRLFTGLGPVVDGPQNEQNFGDGAGTTEARTPSTTEEPLFFFGTPTQPPVNIVETSTLAPSTDSPLEYLGPASKDENKYEGFEYFGSSTEKPCVSSTSTALPPINVASSPPESAEWIGEWPPASSQAPEKTDVENFIDEWQPTSETPNQPPFAWDQETNPPVWNHEPSPYQNTQQPEYSSQQFFDGNHYGGVDYVPENYQEQQYQPQEYDKNYYQVPVQTPNHPGVEFRYLMPKQDPERPIPFVDVDSGERRLVDSFDTPDDLPLKEEDAHHPAFWDPFDHDYPLDKLLDKLFGTPGASGEVRDTFNVPEDLTAHAPSAFSGSPDPEPVDDTFQSVPDHPEVVKSAFEISPSDSGIIVDTFQLPEEENDHYGGYRKKREASQRSSKHARAWKKNIQPFKSKIFSRKSKRISPTRRRSPPQMT
ncbi:unnamed protein product [Bursaphelenchus xylophilus]|uniref:(pine wood nematode) hypothetical protein n=1 Tax=Bursaphelenchus xylophilus TaxID=6326 RepID=A0A7I8WHF9_BURXY|nr:unnamed protein product [Bursaphelenchus xylophilus]CAG9109749.1 unnamed protein product [Bursaphelenchus xylophilus]